jgi:hypothetical protein
VIVERKGSKDLIRREAQRAADARLEPLKDADGNIVMVEQGGRQVPVLKPRDTVLSSVLHPKVGAQGHLANKRGDVIASRANAQERHNRDVAGREHSVRGVRGQTAREIVSMVTEGTILSAKHFEANLRAHRDRLAAGLAQHDAEVARGDTPSIYIDEGEVRNARRRVKLADKILASPKALARAEAIVAEGERHGGALVGSDAELVAAKLADPAELKRARLKVAAVEHMGARHFTAEDHARAEAAARAAGDHALADAVSGKHLGKLAAHRKAQAAVQSTREAARNAAAEQARLEGKVRSMAGAQAVRRGQEAATKGAVAVYHVGGAGGGHSATIDLAYKSGFGVKSFMERTDLHKVRSLTIPPDRSHGRTGTHRLSPAQVAAIDRRAHAHGFERVDHADGSTTWRRPSGGRAPARFERYADAVAHAKAHGLNPRVAIQRVATSAAEAKRVGELRAARRSANAAKARRLQAETQHRIAQHDLRNNPDPPRGEGLRTAEGRQLPDAQIEDFIRSQGRDPNTVAYLPPAVSRRQHHKQFRAETGRGSLTEGTVRTGAAHLKGATETGADLLRAAGVRHAVTLAKAKSIDRLVSEHGMRHPAWAKAQRGEMLTASERRVVDQGGYFTGQEAAEAVKRAEKQGEHLAAIRAFPGKLPQDVQDVIRDNLQGPGGADTLGQRLLQDRFLTDAELKNTRARNVVLVNGHLIDRLNDHLTPTKSALKFAQITNKAFRYAVLPQPRWLVGNFFEPLVVRMPGVGSGINVFGLAVDVRAANRLIGHMERHADPAVRAAAAEIRAHQFGGLLFGNKGLTNRRTLEDFPALDAKVQKIYGGMVAKMPATRQLAQVTGMLLKGGGKVLMAPIHAIFAINRAGEAGLQRAAFGKAVRRDAEEFTRSWAKTLNLGQKAMDDVAKGLTNTATQQRFMEAQHELLGKYEGFSPPCGA